MDNDSRATPICLYHVRQTTGSSFWSIMDITVVFSKVSAWSFSPVVCYMILSLKSSGSEFSCNFHWMWKTFPLHNICICDTILKSGEIVFSCNAHCFLMVTTVWQGEENIHFYSSVWSKPKLKEVVVSIMNWCEAQQLDSPVYVLCDGISYLVHAVRYSRFGCRFWYDFKFLIDVN